MDETKPEQKAIDSANAQFWNELCGTGLAQQLGLTDHSLESLRRFDDAYIDFYPYLLHRIPVDRFKERKVLEVGLGYGTLSQKIAESGAEYTGLDIAAGAAQMVETRLRLTGLPGSAVQGSVLNSGLPSEHFDVVVSIGCFHHTGNVQRCIDETYRMLKPGGEAFIMLYNKFSFRRWTRWPMATASSALRQAFGLSGARSGAEDERAAYDSGSDGAAAPETVFLSCRDIKEAFRDYASVEVTSENSDALTWRGRTLVTRERMLASVGKSMGLDLYISAVK
jgi:SAM-dependent methyltransferase